MWFAQIATAKNVLPWVNFAAPPLGCLPFPEDWDQGVFPWPLLKGRPSFSGEVEMLLCKKLCGKLITLSFVQLWPEWLVGPNCRAGAAWRLAPLPASFLSSGWSVLAFVCLLRPFLALTVRVGALPALLLRAPLVLVPFGQSGVGTGQPLVTRCQVHRCRARAPSAHGEHVLRLGVSRRLAVQKARGLEHN